MIRGLHTAAAGMITEQRKHDTITNNIANIMTPGYKQTHAVARSFPEIMLSLTGVSEDQKRQIGGLNAGVFAEESIAVYAQGTLVQTGRSADFAIVSNINVPGVTFDASGKSVSANGEVSYQPQAMFTVETAGGERRYTRGGQFSVDTEGYLRASGGAYVLDAGGARYQLPAGVKIDDLSLQADGQLADANGAAIGQPLLISRVDQPYQLVRDGNGLFRYEGDEAAVTAANFTDGVEVRQGYYEASNVDAAQASVSLMAAQRAYEANQVIVKYYDQTLNKAVNEIGRMG